MTAQEVQRRSLNQGWTLQATGQEEAVPMVATVPGVVQQDLLRMGFLPDPHVGTNENLVQWVGERSWEYRLSFQVSNYSSERNYQLRFDGLDTYAEVWLNGELILEADNMFRQWTVSVNEWLRAWENELIVRFNPPIEALQDRLAGLPYQLTAGNDTGDPKLAPFARKGQYQFGWDWGLRIVTCGIWRPVWLESWANTALEHVQLVQESLTDERAELDIHVQLSNASVTTDLELRVRNTATDEVWGRVEVPVDQQQIKVPVVIDNPRLWWPNGQGEPYRYAIAVELWQGDQLLDIQEQRIGLRTIELVQRPDRYGESFFFRINGRPIFIKGGSYIPQDVMIPRITRQQKRGLLEQAQAANMNLIRVWGGGVYEDDDFYNTCDSLGLLVWQDFMFACAAYPGDPDFLASVEAEIRDNVRRLRNHPSVMIWCGNNEVYMAWKHWGWKKMVGKDSAEMFQSYEQVFQELIPRILSEEDPSRPYTHTSPLYSWASAEGLKKGTLHYWGVWHGPHDFSGYDTRVGRYMNEYGFQSFPDMETIAAFADSSQWSLESPVMAHHQKSYIGNGLIGEFTEKYGDPADNFSDFVYQSQVVQYEGMRRAITAHRLRFGYCMGTTFWQLNDCWPGPSWSAIDYYGRPKVFFEELKNLYAPIAVCIAGTKRKPQLAIMSDVPQPTEARLEWKRLSKEGTVAASGELQLRIAEAGTQLLPVPSGFLGGQNDRTEIVVKQGEEVVGTFTWKGRYDPMPLPDADVTRYKNLLHAD